MEGWPVATEVVKRTKQCRMRSNSDGHTPNDGEGTDLFRIWEGKDPTTRTGERREVPDIGNKLKGVNNVNTKIDEPKENEASNRENTLMEVGTSNEISEGGYGQSWQDITEPVSKRKKLRLNLHGDKNIFHSAPSSPVLFSSNFATMDLTWDEDAECSKGLKGATHLGLPPPRVNWKDKRGELFLGRKIRATLKEIEISTRNIKEGIPNREIMEIGISLRSMISTLATEKSQALLWRLGREAKPKEGWDTLYKKDLEREEEIRNGKELAGKLNEKIKKMEMARKAEQDTAKKEIETITNDKDNLVEEVAKLKKELENAKEESERLRRQLHEGGNEVNPEMLTGMGTFDKYKKIELANWPTNIFRTAVLAYGSPLETKTADLLLLHEEGSNTQWNEGIRREFIEKYPDIKYLEGDWSALKISTRVLTKEGEKDKPERWVMRSEVGSKQGEWFEALVNIKNKMVEAGITLVALYPPGNDNREVSTRKMTEFIFRNSGIKCLIHSKVPTKGNRKLEGYTRTKTRKKNALIVDIAGRSFTEVLKAVRNQIGPDTETAKAVKSIRQARDTNKMVIVVENNEGEAIKNLVTQVGKLVENKIKVNVNGGGQTIFIRDLDEVTTKEEVAKVISETLDLDKEKINVISLRKTYGG